MQVLNFILLTLISAALGGVIAGAISALAIRWYRISPHEGGSGYFFVTLTAFGIVAGFVIGLVCAICFAANTLGGFGTAAGTSACCILAIGVVTAIVARLRADVPPTIDGETLFLVVEVRTTGPASPFKNPAARIMLGALARGTLRKSEFGPLWANSATTETAAWVAQGAVPVFTSRGKRVLRIEPGDGANESFLVPLPRWPRRRNLDWSDWLPKRYNAAPQPSCFQYRFKVLRHCDPMHVEQFGKLTVRSFADRFEQTTTSGIQQIVSFYRFQILHDGTPLNGMGLPPGKLPDMNLLATFANQPAALLVNTIDQSYSHVFQLITEQDGKPKVEHVAASSMFPSLIELAPTGKPANQRLGSRMLIDKPCLYLAGEDGVIDTRTLAIHHVSRSNASEQNPIKPLGISPDERSFVRLVFFGPPSEPNLAVTDFIADKTYLLPIDRTRMRYNSTSTIDPAWLNHHFRWTQGEDGVDHLVERTDFTVLPYEGDFELRDYGVWLYSLFGVKREIIPILEGILRLQFGARPKAPAAGSVDNKFDKFQIDGAEISVHPGDDSDYVMVWMEKETGAERAAAIAAAFNSELGTGRHDALFAFK